MISIEKERYEMVHKQHHDNSFKKTLCRKQTGKKYISFTSVNLSDKIWGNFFFLSFFIIPFLLIDFQWPFFSSL